MSKASYVECTCSRGEDTNTDKSPLLLLELSEYDVFMIVRCLLTGCV